MEDSILLHNDDKYEMQDENTLSVRQALTTKTAITFLLEGKLKTNVCRYCLNVDAPLSELDRIMHLAIKGVIYNVTIRDMIASFHPIKVADDPNFPTKICEICLEQTLSSYLFTQQCEKAERALRNCLEDIHDKTDKLDPLERTKKRGRQKLNPNYNIIHVEHEKVIDYAEPVINLVNTNTELQDETLKENKLNPHECAKCWQVFPNVPALLNHEKIHPTTMWFHCRICGRSFPKRIQLKRHLLSHAKHTEKTDIIEKFQCKNCGYKTNAYSAHLEHIEKHKFKTALQRLVNNKMDKICSVCLGEGHLANLDKMICLHGGEPGLSGDVSLFNVLGSIIPSMNSRHSYIGNKICEKCYDSVISSYIFINHINNIRIRLNSCISLMVNSLQKIEHPDENVFIEISQDVILKVKDDFDEYLFVNENEEIDESKLKIDVLEDEFREDPETDDDSNSESLKSELNEDSENSSESIKSDVEFTQIVRKHYYNKKKLCNGYQHDPNENLCSEFLTFNRKKTKKTPKKSVTCYICSKRFISNYFLQRHLVKHANKKTECLVCGQFFKSKFYLYEHVKISHLQNINDYYTCDTCGRIFINYNKYKTHLNSHVNKRCNLCDKLFVSQKQFNNHLIRHAVQFRLKKRKAQYCSFCEKDCFNNNELSLHVNKVHLQIKPYACDMCEKNYYTESNLQNHKKLHSLPSREDCKFCNKMLKCRRDLVVHIRKHINNKPFNCKVCSKAFYSETRVMSHMKKVHGGVHCCNNCKSTFSRKGDYKEHCFECNPLSQCY